MNESLDWWLFKNNFEYFVHYDKVFTSEEIDAIENCIQDSDLKTADLADIKSGKSIIRDSKVSFINAKNPENHWIFEKFSSVVIDANERFFKFELNRIESLQYTVYNKSHFYKNHVDLTYQNLDDATRKLSFTMQLSNPDDYKGGELILKNGPEPHIAGKNRGSIIFFPSYVLHEVTPVLKGTRKSIVGWVTGPRWK
ncbi:MAG: 2OG-Fe(II) oxygenase [Chitinophagaceae bacterium]